MRRRLRTSQPNQARVAAPRVRRTNPAREQRRRIRRINRQAYRDNFMENVRAQMNSYDTFDWNNQPTLSPGNYQMRGVPNSIFDSPPRYAAGDLNDQFAGMSLRRRRYR